MRQPQGYSRWIDRESGEVTKERDTFTCSHCCKVVWVEPNQSPEDSGGYCGMCDKLVCKDCAGKPCETFEKQLDLLEHKLNVRRWMGI